jgi:hypothetical protein
MAYSKFFRTRRILEILTCCRIYTILVSNDVGSQFLVDKDSQDLLRAASSFFAAKFDEEEQIITLPK